MLWLLDGHGGNLLSKTNKDLPSSQVWREKNSRLGLFDQLSDCPERLNPSTHARTHAPRLCDAPVRLRGKQIMFRESEEKAAELEGDKVTHFNLES